MQNTHSMQRSRISSPEILTTSVHYDPVSQESRCPGFAPSNTLANGERCRIAEVSGFQACGAIPRCQCLVLSMVQYA